MKKFFDDYFNIKKIVESKKEYKSQMKRVESMPEDYRYVYKEIQNHMWQFVSGAGYDMMELQYGLIDLFEEGIAEGKSVLEVTGGDVAGFIDELLKNTRTYTDDRNKKINSRIQKHVEKLNVRRNDM